LSTYDVRIWSLDRYRGKSKTTYRVRWVVAGKRFVSTFETRKLAESFRAKLVTAAREGIAFDEAAGLPEPLAREKNSRSWYDHACAFVDMKWPTASARHRKSIAESLATVTPALLATDRGRPGDDQLRHALYTWSFNTTARGNTPSDAVSQAARWASMNTLPVADLADPVVVRRALDRLTVTLQGKTAAPTTIARKRAVFAGTVRYAVELGLLDSNPLDKVRWKAPKSTETVDRRVVVNHEQARRLLAVVRQIHPPLEAFYACMYYAALRPAEALHLQTRDWVLPDEGWGELLLTGTTQQTGTAWNDQGTSRENRGLKHRAGNDTRIVPACPDLVTTLRRHLDEFGAAPNGRHPHRPVRATGRRTILQPSLDEHAKPGLAEGSERGADGRRVRVPARAPSLRPPARVRVDMAERWCAGHPGRRVGGPQRRGPDARIRQVHLWPRASR
jgi:integrase